MSTRPSSLKWKWKWTSLDAQLRIDPKAYQFLSTQTQGTGENERGGQLFMDFQRPDGLTIIAATPPHKSDMSGPTWLELDAGRCLKEIVQYNKKGFLLVGYWHTHPQVTPEISSQDIASFKRFSEQNNTSLPHPIAIIVGQSPTLNGIRAWSIQAAGPIPAEIQMD